MINIRLNPLFQYAFLAVFFGVLLLRIFANFNLYNYQNSTVLPIAFIPFGIFYLLKFSGSVNHFSAVHKSNLLFYSLLSFLITIPFIQYILLGNRVDSYSRGSFYYVIIISSLAISWLMAGICLSGFENLDKKAKFFLYSSLLIVISLMFSSFTDGLFVDYYYLSSLRSDDIKIQHLSLTEPITFIIFLFLAANYNGIYKFIALLVFFFILFSLGGRTAFFCALMAFFIFEIISGKFLYVISNIFLLCVVTIIFLGNTAVSDNAFYKKLFFQDGLGSDESFQGRKEFLSDFFENIVNQLAFGNPNILIDRHNDLGTYSHNLLSVIQFYGIIPFIIIVYCFYFFTKKIILLKIYKSQNILNKFGILMLIYVVLSVITGKAVLYAPLWFVIGFWLFRLKNFSRDFSNV